MDEKPLSAKAICSIIDKCGKNGVSSFKFHGLELEFTKKEEFPEQIVQKVDQNASFLEETEKKVDPRESFLNLLEESKYLDPVLYEKLVQLEEPINEKAHN